jgi:hypothetical protein
LIAYEVFDDMTGQAIPKIHLSHKTALLQVQTYLLSLRH